ncbi:hypothetical protein HPB50_024050 [Hyalomma asiaticum]|uniref:Uncharacterized protein n=1 Tax=Hyalomma asiaticum TaxID=266040 RepID=A0ACB7SNV1_HYAAI|nr:hypothetical protein HPB50_024050 [Hyalomma asiaticum]
MLESVIWLTTDHIHFPTQVLEVGLDCVRLVYSLIMAFRFLSLARCLLMVVLLSGHGGVLTSVNSQALAECGNTCGGYVGRKCVKECHCVFYRGSDYGICRAVGLNETYLPEMRVF